MIHLERSVVLTLWDEDEESFIYFSRDTVRIEDFLYARTKRITNNMPLRLIKFDREAIDSRGFEWAHLKDSLMHFLIINHNSKICQASVINLRKPPLHMIGLVSVLVRCV